MIGIYKITNVKNKKFYIGSSNKVKPRWNLHKHELRKNKHHSSYLQNSWNKYGESSFKFEVVEKCFKKNLLEREQYFLDILKPSFNMNMIAHNCTGRPVSKTTRDKISKGNTGKKHSEETKKKISKHRLDNPLIFTKEIREKIRQSKIGNKNPMFGKKSSQKQKDAVVKALTGKGRTQDVKDKIAKANSISVVQLDLNSVFIKEWSSTMEVQRNLRGFLGSGVTRCCKGSRQTYKNYIWKYKEEYNYDKSSV